MTTDGRRPSSPPAEPRPDLSARERDLITARLGPLPTPLMLAVRDARGPTFQRLEFLGDAVLELVLRFHARITGGDADALVTDAALADTAARVGLDAWTEWEPSRARQADLVEACAAAVWLAHGWTALTNYADAIVTPFTPVTSHDVETGWHGPLHGDLRRTHEILGASVLEVAAANLAYTREPGDEFALTTLRNALYGSERVADLAHAAGWLDGPLPEGHRSAAQQRDHVEDHLADLALDQGLPAAVDAATSLIG